MPENAADSSSSVQNASNATDSGNILQQAMGNGASEQAAANASNSGHSVASPETISLDDAWDLVLQKLYTWYENGVALLPNIVLGILVIIAFWVAGAFIQRSVNRFLKPRLRTDAAIRLIASSVKVALIAIGLFIALKLLGLSGTVASLLAGAGIIGIAVGFAFQDVLENYIIGFLMSVRKPFETGDIIKTNDYMGYVRGINLRNTLIEDFLGQMIIIPNKEVYRNPIENYSYTGYRKIEFEIGTSYGDDPEKVIDVTTQALQPLDFVDSEDKVEMYAMSFGAYAINYILRVNVDFPQTSYFSARSAIVTAIHRAYNENDILIPWPIRTLDFNAKGGRSLEDAMPPPREAKHREQTDEDDETGDGDD